MIGRVRENWNQAIGSRFFVIQLSITAVTLVLLSLFIGRFFIYVQSVEGSRLNDPLLAIIRADDVSAVVFTLIYGGILTAVVYLSAFPYLLLKAGQAYVLLTLMRMVTIFFFPLEPDEAIVALKDPLVDRLFYEHQLITKDLFFSGHVSVIAMLAIVSKNFYIKRILATIALMVAIALLIQHVHYTIDVVAAPFFAWISVVAAEKIPQPSTVR
jgi:membrane-associated phospholipid phosphatase